LDYGQWMGALVPAFAVERHGGLLDVWVVYQALIERMPETAIETAFRQPEIASLVRPRVADELAAQARRCRDLLRDAIAAGEWQLYLDEIRLLAARCAA